MPTVDTQVRGNDGQDDESYSIVPDSEFVVSRAAYRNNTSKYFINDRTSTFTEVTTLLKNKGIDLDNNRFLILQVSRLPSTTMAPTKYAFLCTSTENSGPAFVASSDTYL